MNYTHKTLKNGLNIFLLNIPDADSVVFSVLIKVGSRYENEPVAGVAHFLEHVFFKGSRNYPTPTSMSMAIDGVGGDFNAATGKESTEFYIRAEKHNIDLVFDTLTDMIQNPLFNPEEIEKEKGVVLEEINLYQDNPGSQVESNLEDVVWPSSALGRDILGFKKTVTGLTREDIFAFKEAYYQPSNMILGMSGAFDEQAILEKIEQFWGNIKNKKVGNLHKQKFVQNKPQIRIENKPTQQAHLALGFKSYGYGHKYNTAVLLLSSILGGSASSRLVVTIREQQGLAYYIRASNSQYADTGIFTIHAGLKIENTVSALGAILGEIRRIKSDHVTPAELQRSKDYIKGRVALSLENNHDKLGWIIERFAFHKKVETTQELFERLDRVTAADLSKVANDMFINERMSLAVIGPFKDSKEFSKQLFLKENY